MLTTGQTLPKLLSRGRSLSYAGIGLLIAATSVAGFGPTYYFKGFFATPPLTSLVHVHAVVMTCWTAMRLVARILYLL